MTTDDLFPGQPASASQPGHTVTLDNCADEAIHLPGKIQPHGALLVFDATGLVVAWSSNTSTMLCLGPIIGQPASDLGFMPEVMALIDQCMVDLVDGAAPANCAITAIGSQPFHCIVHGHQWHVLVEFEMRRFAEEESVSTQLATVQRAIDLLRRQKTVPALLQVAVQKIRQITGFDRVMAYRFRDDDSGEVVAEDCLDTLEPYLGQRYPASDIPAQARRLYIINSLRLIVDINYAPITLQGKDYGNQIDLSHSVLRSVSPVHVEYLQNMGVAASMSISIVINDRLWGLLACHHMGTRQVPYPVRVGCDLVAQVLASAAHSVELAERQHAVAQSGKVLADLMRTLQSKDDIFLALFQHAPALCDSLCADALILVQNGELQCHGNVPDHIAMIIIASLPLPSETLLQRTQRTDWPELSRASLMKWVGLLGICFDNGVRQGWMLALRVEQIETVRWGGRPNKPVVAGPLGPRLTPRGSFDEWRETVRGSCKPWNTETTDAARILSSKLERFGHADLARRATYDTLTGLPNRSLLHERISNALQRSARSGNQVALLFVDVDGLKRINDMYGHEAGDFLLCAVGQRLTLLVRHEDTVAHLSGDEFILLIEQVSNLASVHSLGGRINAALRQAVHHDGVPLFVTASVGISIGRGGTHTGADLLRHADAAMYSVKQSGRDSYQFFDEDVHARARLRMHISNGLQMALERDELSVRFQPIVVADTGRMVGAELLLRWCPPEGEISPAVFIPIAEMTRAIVPIGAWVFLQACKAEIRWRQRWSTSAPYISVNISAKQLNERTLHESFAAMLRDTGADPDRIVLEITETALMADIEANIRILQKLTDLGLRLAVDDFGTGYSSLAQLIRLPVSILKIDRAFIEGIDKRPEIRNVVRAILFLGRSLKLTIVAEGVETAAQQFELCAFGCDLIQGYRFHRPMLEQQLSNVVEQDMAGQLPHAVLPLHFLIYVSTASIILTANDLEELLVQSRINNAAVGVTGCLLYLDGAFMQILEGTEVQVRATFAKISIDNRHCDVRLVMEGKAHRRQFADWNMLLRDLAHSKREGLDFGPWTKRKISFQEIADDARTCYAYITGIIASDTT